jgi:glycosyltransferase involved in cell wall biosynthesis
MTPSLSVVIPSYNHARFVGAAIESARAQTLPPSEIIVVDDGSTDDTPTQLANAAAPVRVIRQENRGVAAARNTGARAARGELLAFLDADDLWQAEKLERQVARLVSRPRVGLVYCGLEEMDAEGGRGRRRLEGAEERIWEELLLCRPRVIIGGSAALVPRAVFTELGGFDETLSTSADWDLYYRLSRRYDVQFVAEPLVRYRIHGRNMHANVDLMARDMMRAYEKAFAEETPDVQRLRRRAYGRLHLMLAASFFGTGRYRAFGQHALRSLWLAPETLRYFVTYPARGLSRLLGGGP